MWEVLYRLSHGRVSVRRFSLVLSAVFMAFFMALSTIQPAFADDIQRGQDGSVTYQGNKYAPIRSADGTAATPIPSGLPAGTDGYYRSDAAAKKAYFLLTSGTANQASTAQYVVYDFLPPDTFTGASPPVSVNFTSATTIDGTNSEGDQAPTSGSTCDGSTLSGIGWIVCPVVNLLANSMDFIYGIISDFLEVKTVTADTSGPVYRLWSIVRDIANICFVIVFLFIVYSQVTSLGISNYGLKKMLPKLIIAAILMNTSYWISAFAVDASNLLGYSIHSLFKSVFDTLSVGANYTGSIPTWQQVAAVALASTGAVVGGITILSGTISGSILLLIPILVSVALSALVALLVLAARQALLMCLIIISPLAFVGFVLPNTEKYFEKWRSTFLTLLMLFPIFSVIFSGAQLAGMAIVQTSGGNLITIILGMGVQVAPIVITPLLVKFSSGLIGKIAGMVNNPNKGLVDRTRNWAKGAQQERKNKILSDQNLLKKFNKYSPALAGTRALDSQKRRRDARRKAYEAGAENRYDATETGQRTQALARDMQSQKQEVANRFERSSYGQRSNFRSQMANIDKDRTTTEFERSSYGHRVDHAKRTAEQDKKLVHSQHERDWNRAVRTDAGLLKQELSVKEGEIQAGLEKAKLDTVHAEVIAQGHSTEHILNLRGVDARTQAGMLDIAHNIRRDNLETSAAHTAKGMADRVVAEYKSSALSDNTIKIDGKTIVEYAGGIKGISGQRAVAAKAGSEVSAVVMEDIKNISSTMDWSLSTDNEKLYDRLKSSTDLAEKVAYTKAMAKNGGPGVAKLRQVLTELGNDGGGIVKKDDLLTFKEILSSEGKIMSSGKDIELYLTNAAHLDSSGNVQINIDGTPKHKTFNELSLDIGTWKNMAPSAFATQNATTQFFALQYLHDNDHDAYMRIINGIRTNPGALGAVKQGVVDKFSIYSDAVIKAMKSQGENPIIGEIK